jgi:hypothetical protein
VLVGLFQDAEGFEVGNDSLAGVEAVEAAVFLGGIVVDLRIQRQDGDHWQTVALANSVVVEVMCRRDFDAAGAEFEIDVAVGDDRNFAIGQRQFHHLADHVLVALVFRVDHHGGVAKHGFRPGGGYGQRAAEPSASG